MCYITRIKVKEKRRSLMEHPLPHFPVLKQTELDFKLNIILIPLCVRKVNGVQSGAVDTNLMGGHI